MKLLKWAWTELNPIILIAILVIGVVSKINAQEGHYLLSHHNPNIESLDNLNFQIAVDSKGQLCLANRSGLLLFDGQFWDYMPTPSAALSVALDSADNIYVGCVGNFGRIGYKNRQIQYLSLSDTTVTDELFFRTININDVIYYLSDNRLATYKPQSDSLKQYQALNESQIFLDIFEFDGRMILQASDGFFQLENKSLVEVKFPHVFDADIVFIRKHPSEDKYLFGTADNRLYSVEGNRLTELKSSQYIQENQIYMNDAVWIDEQSYAVSTLENGCLIFDSAKDELEEIISNKTGLPDNEIYCIATDKEQGLWLAHEFGLSRVESNIPIKNFSTYHGLEGNLMQAVNFNDKLYVSTSLGVYYLDTENQYKNAVYYTLKKPKKKSVPTQSKTTPQKMVTQTKTTSITRGTKTNFLKKFLKGKKADVSETVQVTNQQEEPEQKKEDNKKGFFGRLAENIGNLKTTQLLRIKKINPETSKLYERHVKREIIDTRYLYKPIEGVNTKSKQFIKFKGHLLVSGNSGLYEIKGQNAELVIQEPVRYVEVDDTGEHLIISTYTNEVKVFELTGNIWVEINSIDFYGEIILAILNDEDGITWMASASRLFKMNSLTATAEELVAFGIPNHFIDDVRLTKISGRISVINSLGYFYLNDKKGAVEQDSAIYKKIGKPHRHLLQGDGSVWVFNGKKWYQIDKEGMVNPYEHFGLFPDMTFIGKTNDQFWLIDDYKELYKFDVNQYDSLLSNNQMFFKRVTNNTGYVNMKDQLVFSHDNNTLQFVLSRPDYLGLLNVEYQYKLKGLNDKWSSWNANNKIDFSYLPDNNYVLTVRSRDSFGNIQESSPFEFRIKPPYWKTVWFYALQIILMSALVIGSARMNRKAEKKYVLLTEGLTILTIVLIIEFLQAVAQEFFGIETSPVADFAVSVGVALLVFPLEQYLKKVMRADPSVPGLSGKGLFDLVAMIKKK